MSDPSFIGRRAVVAGLVLLAVLAPARRTFAEDVSVPVGLQAELLAKVAAYDRNLAARAGDKVRVLIVAKGGNSDSTRVAAHMERSLRALGTIAGLDHEETTVTWAGVDALVQRVRSSRAAIVYFAPGFRDEAGAIARAFNGTNILTASALADLVPRGIVLGFDLVSGKPKIVINLPQARKQDVAFRAEVLKLAKVVE